MGRKSHVNVGVIGGGVQYLISRRPGVGTTSHVILGVIVGGAVFNQ